MDLIAFVTSLALSIVVGAGGARAILSAILLLMTPAAAARIAPTRGLSIESNLRDTATIASGLPAATV